MMKQLIAGIAMATTAATGLAATPALAHDDDGGRYQQGYNYGYGYGRGDDDGYARRGYDNRGWGGDRHDYERRGYYDGNGYYGGYYGGYYNSYPRAYAYRTYPTYYRGDYHRCDGTTGTVVGAVAGGLIGNGLSHRYNRGAGTVIGAIAGALAGNAIERSGDRCY